MKKHDEGYALVLVVVVMAVLMLVALSVLSLSLRNLQSQQASIERMQAKYAAQGEIEKVVAALDHPVSGTVKLLKSDTITIVKNDDTDDTDDYTLIIKVHSDTVQITCTITLTMEHFGETNDSNNIEYYCISNLSKIEYTSYEITTVDVETASIGGDA